MVRKMKSVGANDVTKLTRYDGIRAISGEQKYYWWELPDQTIVGVLMRGYPGKKKLLLEAEVGVPGGGVAEIEHWSDWRESKKLKTLYPDGTFRLKINQPP